VGGLRTVQHVRGQTGQVPVLSFFIMDVMCVAGQCLRLTQKEVQRSPVLTRLEADGASGAIPLPFPIKFLRLWKYRMVEQGMSSDDLISVIEVRVAAGQKLSNFLIHKLGGACSIYVTSFAQESGFERSPSIPE
jgi:hypothetical protein